VTSTRTRFPVTTGWLPFATYILTVIDRKTGDTHGATPIAGAAYSRDSTLQGNV
jgi:hypothetical protein